MNRPHDDTGNDWADAQPTFSLDNHLSVGIRETVRDTWRGRSLWAELGPPIVSLRSPGSLKIASFDVFDTLITRVSLDPESVWTRMAELMEEQDLVAVHHERVVGARLEAQHNTASEPFPVLERIHQEMARLLGWDKALATWSAAAEIQAERQMSRPVPAGISLLRAVREQIPRIVYASDMHLPSRVIRDLLQVHGCWVDGDSLWVSAEAGVRKRTGQMFRSIADAEQISPAEMVHVGDQPVADCAAPRWIGVRVAPLRNAAPTRYERVFSSGPESIGTRVANAARTARLAHHDLQRGIVDVATGVVGPFLVGYALWLLREADMRGIRRLYFLSRDGEVLLAATAAVADALGAGPELRYLYGGRMAWMLPATDVASDEQWSRLLDYLIMRHTKVTTSVLALRLGLDAEQLNELVTVESTMPLDPINRSTLRSEMESGELRTLVREHAEEQARLAIQYLRQEGLGDRGPFAVVDVGWSGGTMRALASLVSDWAQPPLSLFVGYSGSTGSLPGGHAAYLWDGSDSRVARGLPPIIEMFCSGTHGGVLGYESTSAGVTPRLLTPVSVAWESWPLSAMRRVLSTFLDEFAPTIRPHDLEASTGPAVTNLLRLFRATPTSQEASAWGSFPREEDPQGESVFPMARAYTLSDLRLILRPGPFAGRNLTWPEAALVLTPAPTRALVRAILRGVAFGRRLRGEGPS